MKAIIGSIGIDRWGSKIITALLLVGASVGFSQGMPPEVRNNIHALFDSHGKVSRNVTLTEDGYVSVTESNDPKLAETLKNHVVQMQARLGRGGFIRRWDPAFTELVEHYGDILHEVVLTAKGLKVTVVGQTPEAIKVAQNHAKIVSDFAAKGWAEHDVRHPRAIDTHSESVKTGEKAKGESCGASCCRDTVAAEKTKGDSVKIRACCQSGTGSQKKN